MNQFKDRIHTMNTMYQLPVEPSPTAVGPLAERLAKFKRTLIAEVNEIDEIISASEFGSTNEIDLLVMIADLLGDITVYCRSEAMKYGIPLEEVLELIMDSNESKLDENGQPIYDENGKFLKGPNYWKPEPKIKELLIAHY